MSDHFQMLVDVEATSEQSANVVQLVIARFHELGLITGKANKDCTLGDDGYRPGPAMHEFYRVGKREGRFWELITCGVEPTAGRSFNQWALGAVCEGFTCPACEVHMEPYIDPFFKALGIAIGDWLKEAGPAIVPCPECHIESSVQDWQCRPPLGFGNVSFTFWNWPPFDRTEWKIDVVGIVQEVSGHNIVRTYGHL